MDSESNGTLLMALYIPHELPDLNGIVAASKNHWSQYAKLKKSATATVAAYARQRLKPIGNRRVRICCVWGRSSWRKDPDNVSHGIKYILDGLVDAGILTNDTSRYIGEIRHVFEHAEQTGVQVLIEAMESDLAEEAES